MENNWAYKTVEKRTVRIKMILMGCKDKYESSICTWAQEKSSLWHYPMKFYVRVP